MAVPTTGDLSVIIEEGKTRQTAVDSYLEKGEKLMKGWGGTLLLYALSCSFSQKAQGEVWRLSSFLREENRILETQDITRGRICCHTSGSDKGQLL